MIAPCKGCKGRSPTCHAGCQKYKVYAEDRERIRKARALSKEIESVRIGNTIRNAQKRR